MEFGLVFIWWAFPFGWSESPGYFRACAGLITFLRFLHNPMSPITGLLTFASHMSVGDAIIIDVDFPWRLGRSDKVREQCYEQVLDVGTVRDKRRRYNVAGRRNASC